MHDQLAVILVIKCVTNNVNERLIALVDYRSGTGKNLCDVVCDVLKRLNLDVKAVLLIAQAICVDNRTASQHGLTKLVQIKFTCGVMPTY